MARKSIVRDIVAVIARFCIEFLSFHFGHESAF